MVGGDCQTAGPLDRYGGGQLEIVGPQMSDAVRVPGGVERPDDVGPCPFCGGPAVPALESPDRNRELSRECFRYRRCRACGTFSLVNVPDDLKRFYPEAENYYGLYTTAELARLASAEAHKLKFVRERVEPGRLVEVGPGAGVFAFAASRAGFDVTAIEMDPRTCEHLRTEVGVHAIHHDDPAAALARLEPSRAIAMWHVLEHLVDPAALLDAVAANLEPGGVFALSTPNPRSLQFRLLGARWAHLDAPRHLNLIPLEALTRRVAAVGLRRVEATTSDPTGRNCNYLGWEYGMRRRPAAAPTSRLTLLATFGLAFVLRPIESTGLRGAAYTAVFVKDG
jgi:SAM-dependent methyltransferase